MVAPGFVKEEPSLLPRKRDRNNSIFAAGEELFVTVELRGFETSPSCVKDCASLPPLWTIVSTRQF
jgi:hypothetical protein